MQCVWAQNPNIAVRSAACMSTARKIVQFVLADVGGVRDGRRHPRIISMSDLHRTNWIQVVLLTTWLHPHQEQAAHASSRSHI